MKQQAIQYVALDVHQATLVASVRDEQGSVAIALKPVYHGASALLTLKELVRSYVALVEDGTRVMLRIKALFRARGIRTPGTSVYRPSKRKEWLARLEERGARMRAEALLAELDVLQELRPKAKAAMQIQPGPIGIRPIPFTPVVRWRAAMLPSTGRSRPAAVR